MNEKSKIKLNSPDWLPEYYSHIAGYFREAGFEDPKEVMNMRVFDLMNINRIDPIRAEEILICLYEYFNPNTETDEAMYMGLMGQNFDYAGWRKKHKDAGNVKVTDLVMADHINEKALQHLYDGIRKKFFSSGEYDRNEYRYRNRDEYLKSLKKNRSNKKNG